MLEPKNFFIVNYFLEFFKKLGSPSDPEIFKRKIEILYEVAIDKSAITHWVQDNRYNFDTEGNLYPRIVGELRYCARPVPRALEEFSKRGKYYDEENRDFIDLTFLKGLWTPIDFVDNARLRAQEE